MCVGIRGFESFEPIAVMVADSQFATGRIESADVLGIIEFILVLLPVYYILPDAVIGVGTEGKVLIAVA